MKYCISNVQIGDRFLSAVAPCNLHFPTSRYCAGLSGLCTSHVSAAVTDSVTELRAVTTADDVCLSSVMTSSSPDTIAAFTTGREGEADPQPVYINAPHLILSHRARLNLVPAFGSLSRSPC